MYLYLSYYRFCYLQIKENEDMIACNEIREAELKEIFFRLLKGKMRYLVSSQEALQIFNYVEFAYEQLIAPNDTKQSSVDMMIALELEYDNLMLEISSYDLKYIKEIEKEIYELGDREIKKAKEAAKMLKNVDKLHKRLKSSYEPSRKPCE